MEKCHAEYCFFSKYWKYLEKNYNVGLKRILIPIIKVFFFIIVMSLGLLESQASFAKTQLANYWLRFFLYL